MDCTTPPKVTVASSESALAALVDGLLLPTADECVRFQCEGAVGGKDPQLRIAPAGLATVAASLIDRFDVQDLLATHCFELDAHGSPTLIAGLRVGGTPVLITHAADNLAPLAIIGEGQPATVRPVIADVFQDAETRRRIEAFGGVLIVAATLDEAIAWRFLGLAAAPIGELAGCPQPVQRQTAKEWAELERIAKPPSTARNALTEPQLNLSTPFPQAEPIVDSGAEMRLNAVLVVPTWNPITLMKIADGEACPVAKQLLDIERSANCDFGGIGVWRPNAATIAAVATNLAAGNRTQVAKLLRQSLADALWMAEAEEPDLANDSSADLVAAQRELFATREFGMTEGRQAAATKYLRLVEERLVNPLREAGLASADPIRGTVFEAIADTRRLLSQVSAADDRELALDQPADSRLKDHVKLHCQLTSNLLKLFDALKETNHARRWNTKFGR